MIQLAAPSRQPEQKAQFLEWTIGLILLGLAIVFRTAYLDEFPSFIHNDEAAAAIHISPPFLRPNPDSPFYGFNNYGGHANFGAWLTSLSLRMFGGQTLWAIRMGSMVCGVLSLALFALCIRGWLGSQTALLFLLVAAPFHLHLHYSRTGFHYIQAATFSALVAFLFGRLVAKPSVPNASALGIGLGFAVLVYSATHVLPGVVGVALLALLVSDNFKARFAGKRLKAIILLGSAILGGALLAIGRHLWFILQAGRFQSRLESQFIFEPGSAQRLQEGASYQAALIKIFWESLHKTVRFFYQGDSAVQYGVRGAPLEYVSYTLAGVGVLALLGYSGRRDPVAVFMVVLGAATFLGSALMVEGNFSPHLVVFSLLIPLCIAVGFNVACRFLRMTSPIWVAAIALVAFVPWTKWNYGVLLDTDSRKRTIDTFTQHLPIDRDGVRTLLNLTPQYADFGESHYKLRYPHGTGRKENAINPGQQALVLLSAKECPCVVLVERARGEEISKVLSAEGKSFRKFSFEKSDTDVFYLDQMG